MKATKHVEHLLRQGRKPKELVELGFSKSVVTKVRKQLSKEKAGLQTKMPKGVVEAENRPEPLASATEMARTQSRPVSAEGEPQKVGKLMKALPELAALMAAAQDLGTRRRQNCPYQEDSICALQTWTSQSEIPQGIGEPVIVKNEVPEWYIKPSPFYCAMCTASLEGRLDDVESEVSGNPLSGVRYRITCKGCGSREWIAAAVKCTKCGREAYWGWCPKKE